MKRKMIIRVVGKASQVFRLISLLAKYQGTKTIGELR